LENIMARKRKCVSDATSVGTKLKPSIPLYLEKVVGVVNLVPLMKVASAIEWIWMKFDPD
jgi:hypothetical protein